MKLTARIQKKYLFHRLLGLFLIAAMLGVSPGIFDTSAPVRAANNTPFTEAAVQVDKDSPMAVSSTLGASASTSVVIADNVDDSVKKREMSKAEEIAWSIGKAMLPTLAVMALSAAIVCPLAWVVIGAVAVGATAAGAMTLAYELRKNSFRDQGQKKGMDKILREVSIQAAISGALAPFNMLTGGLVQSVGPLTVKTIVSTAAKAGAISFLGSTVSNVAKGTVTNLWYDHYYNYDEREKELKKKIQTLSAIQNPDEEQQKELVAALKELDTISKEKHTWDRFRKDETKALVSAGISGVMGGIAGRLGAESSWAKIASSKLFGSTSKANLVSNAVISNPFAFATGAASAAVDKKEILNQIEYNRLVQSKYEQNSPAWNYYEGKIADLEEAYKSIKLSEAGKSAMLSNAAMQAAVVGTSLAKTRLWDLPSQKRQKIQQSYEEQDPEWQKANEIRQRLEVRKADRPQPGDYATKREYSQALKQYSREVSGLRTEYQAAKAVAGDSQSSVGNKEVIKDIENKVSKDIEYSRQSELARALGRESYVDFKVKELGKKSENEGLSTQELRTKAEAEVAKGYDDAAKANAMRLAGMEEKAKRQTQELLGKVERGNDGKQYVVVTDENGNEVMRTEYKGGEGAFWVDRVKNNSVAELKQAEIDTVVRRAYNASAMVKPTSFRNEYVNMRVNKLRAEGYTEKQIDGQLGGIVDDANSKTFNIFGGWAGVTKAEILASGLEKARYDDGAAPDAGKIVDFLKKTLTSKTISTVENELSGGIQNGLQVVAPKTRIRGIDPFKALDLEDRDQETLDRLTEKAMRDYYNKR